MTIQNQQDLDGILRTGRIVLSVQFEHAIIVTQGAPIIATLPAA